MLRAHELLFCFILLYPVFFCQHIRANNEIRKNKMGTLRWGIASAGKITNDFVSALKNLPSSEQVVVAVAARDKSRADEFASKHNISSAYSSYEELAKDPNVDVVYVGSINTQHLPISKLMLDHGKHVLCEKPLSLNYKQAEELLKDDGGGFCCDFLGCNPSTTVVSYNEMDHKGYLYRNLLNQYAELKGLFLMEAIWSRFFPVYEEVRKALESKVIGDVKQLTANFGFNIQSDRVRQKSLGGSAVLDVGVYPLQLSSLVFGRNASYEIVSAGHVSDSNVDESFTSIIKYPGGKTASLIVHTHVNLENDAYIYGTDGFIKIHQPMWCPTKVTIKGETKEFPLPDNVKGSYNYFNSPGLQYEAKEVRRCIQEGLLESPLMSHDDSRTLAKMEDTVRKQLGVKFDVDEN